MTWRKKFWFAVDKQSQLQIDFSVDKPFLCCIYVHFVGNIIVEASTFELKKTFTAIFLWPTDAKLKFYLKCKYYTVLNLFFHVFYSSYRAGVSASFRVFGTTCMLMTRQWGVAINQSVDSRGQEIVRCHIALKSQHHNRCAFVGATQYELLIFA